LSPIEVHGLEVELIQLLPCLNAGTGQKFPTWCPEWAGSATGRRRADGHPAPRVPLALAGATNPIGLIGLKDRTPSPVAEMFTREVRAVIEAAGFGRGRAPAR